MKTKIGFSQGLSEAVDNMLDALTSNSVYQPEPLGDDLFSEPFTLPRTPFGGQVNVPDNHRMIVWGRNGFCKIFEPGVYRLLDCPAGRLNARLVNLSQRSLALDLINLHTKDLAKISLKIDVEYRVNNPKAVIQIKSPLETLTQLVTSTTRQEAKKRPHRSFFEDAEFNEKEMECQIRASLEAEGALTGLRIVSVKIVNIEGDPEHLTLASKEALAEQQRQAEEAVLQTRQQLAHSERKLTLFQAETERLATSTREEVALDEAERQASIFESESDRREYQREKEERLLAHEQMMARIEALSRIVAAWGDPRYPGFVNGPYAQTNNTNSQEQNVTKIIDHLLEPQEIRVSAGSNGHGKPSTERKNGTVATKEK